MDDNTYTYSLDVPEFEHAPRTVVSLVPSMTETLFDLMLGDRLVARTDYCIYPADRVGAVSAVGGPKNPDIQRVIDLAPDLVIVNQEENRREDFQALTEAGLTVWVTFPRTVTQVFNLLWDTMNLFDYSLMVPRVRLIEQTYDWVFGITRSHEDQPVKVFAPIWNDPWMTFNGETYAHDLLRICGGTNIFAERERRFPLAADLGEAEAYPDDDPRVVGRDRRYPRVTLDEVVAAQPDVVLLPTEPYAFTEDHIAIFSKLDIPAAKNNRIHLVDGTYLTWHGTRIAYALDTLPALFYPTDEL